MRRIGIAAEYFYPHLGGISDHIYFSALELMRRGHEVTILTGHEGEGETVKLPDGLRVLRLAKSVPIYTTRSIGKVSLGWNVGKRIRETLEREKFDLLHIHSPIDPVIPILSLKYSNTVTVGTLHSYFGSVIYFKILKRIVQNYLNKLDGLIAVSDACIEAMNRYFTVDCRIIPNGVNVDFFSRPKRKIEKFDDGDLNIFFLARLDPRNGLDLLLEAFPLVLKEVPRARLVIAGDGPLRSYYEEKAGELLNRRVFFEGAIFESRPDYFATSHVFCYPADHATFGITLLEAMAAGVPVVATDNPGFRCVMEDGKHGLLAEGRSPETLARALVQALSNPSLAKDLVQNGRRRADEYSWSKVVDRVLEYYNRIYFDKRKEAFVS